jgi:hypothetical protein
MVRSTKKYTSIELRPNAIICVFYADGLRGVVEQFGLQNPTVRVRRAGELVLKHEDDKLVLTIVSVENLHIH